MAAGGKEISLDLDMASAICSKSHILLVEASSSSLTNLGTAVNTVARLGATEMSNGLERGGQIRLFSFAIFLCGLVPVERDGDSRARR